MLIDIKNYAKELDLCIHSNAMRMFIRVSERGYPHKGRVTMRILSLNDNKFIRKPALFKIQSGRICPCVEILKERMKDFKTLLSSSPRGRINKLCYLGHHDDEAFGGASHGDNTHLWMKATEFEDYMSASLENCNLTRHV